jgi:hypothetical protein
MKGYILEGTNHIQTTAQRKAAERLEIEDIFPRKSF